MKSPGTRSGCRRETWVLTALAIATALAWLTPQSAPRAVAQVGTSGKTPMPPPTGTGAGFYREGNNVSRNAPTRVPPADCKASANAMRQEYASLVQQRSQAKDATEKGKISDQIRDLESDWALLQKDCGDQGSLGGGGQPAAGGTSHAGAPASPGAPPGGGGGGGGSEGGGASPAPGAPPEHGLAPLMLADLILAHPAGRPPPKATGLIDVLDRGAWHDLQEAWARIGHLHPASQPAPGSASGTPGPGGGVPAAPGGGGSPSGGSGGASAPPAGSGPASPPSAEQVLLPDDATDADRLGAAAVEARRAEAADLNQYAASEEQYQQAEAARDSAAMLREAEAMLQFAEKALADAHTAAEKQHEYEGQIVDALNGMQATLVEQGKSWPKALEQALARVRKDGLPSEVKEPMAAAKVPASEVEGLQTRLASYTPADVAQGVTDLKARYTTREKVRTALAAHAATTTWPPPPDIAALEAARDAAQRLKEQAGTSTLVVPAPAPARPPAATRPEPEHRGLFAGFDAWWLIPAAVGLLVLLLVVFGIRRRARRAGGPP